MKHAQLIFFIGKGGVGKTTCSVATAVNLAQQGMHVLLVSLDPAHNTGDALQVTLGDQKTTVTPTLDALEIDLEQQIQRYLQQTSNLMKHTYKHVTVLNLEHFFDVLRYSPGIEEHATFEALKEIIVRDAAHYDAIIFDTAPTGQTLRVLALPSVSLAWTEKLIHLRQRILHLRGAIEHIHGDHVWANDHGEKLAAHVAEDHTIQELYRSQAELREMHDLMSNPALTTITAVLNAEDLPLLETQRAAATLKKFQLPLKMLVINKVFQREHLPAEFERKQRQQQDVIARIHQAFKHEMIVEAPWQQEEPRGLGVLAEFGGASARALQELLARETT